MTGRPEKFALESVLEIDDRSVGHLLEDLGDRDLALVLRIASPEVRDRLLAGLSERRAAVVKDACEEWSTASGPEIAAARKRFEQVFEWSWEMGDVVFAEALAGFRPELAIGPDLLVLPEGEPTWVLPVTDGQIERTIEVFVSWSEVRRERGILALEPLTQAENYLPLRHGMQLAIDGTHPDRIRELLGRKLRSLREAEATKRDLVVEAVVAIASGLDSRNLRDVLESRLPGTERPAGEPLPADPPPISAPAPAALLEWLALHAPAFRDRGPAPGAPEDFLTHALRYLRERLPGPEIRRRLAIRKDAELARIDLLGQILIAGIVAIEEGDNPRIVENELRAFLP